jgi:hypothetical protein
MAVPIPVRELCPETSSRIRKPKARHVAADHQPRSVVVALLLSNRVNLSPIATEDNNR